MRSTILTDMSKRKPVVPSRKRTYDVFAGVDKDPSFGKIVPPAKKIKLNPGELNKKFEGMNLNGPKKQAGPKPDAVMVGDDGENIIHNEASLDAEESLEKSF